MNSNFISYTININFIFDDPQSHSFVSCTALNQFSIRVSYLELINY